MTNVAFGFLSTVFNLPTKEIDSLDGRKAQIFQARMKLMGKLKKNNRF